MGARDIVFDILAIDRASKVLDGVGDKASKLGGHFGVVGEKIAYGLATVGAGGIAALSAGLANGIKDAVNYQTISEKTAAVIKSTGDAAHVSVKGLQDYAGQLESLSGIDEETILNGENVLLTFTNVQNKVGKGNDIFNQATLAATNMSAALGQDMQSSVIQLGKALNDPVKGITALSRVGVSFTQQQKDQIAAMVKAGDTMGAQKVILGELNKEFGGAAKAAGSGFAGSLARVQDAVGDSFRAVGQMLLPVITKLADLFVDKVAPALQDGVQAVGVFFQALSGNSELNEFDGALQKVNNAGVNLRDLLSRLAGIFRDDVVPAAKATFDVLVSLGETIYKYRAWLEPVAVGILAIVAAWKAYQGAMAVVSAVTKAYTAIQAALNAVMSMNPIGLIVLALVGLAAGLIYAYKKSETFRDIVNGAFHAVQDAASFMWDKVLRPTIKFLVDAWLTAAGTIVDGAASAFGWVPGIGGKLKAAAAKFDSFRDQVNDSLSGIHDKTVNVTIRQNFVQVGSGPYKGKTLPGFAGGVDDFGGGAAVVGERGPEVVTMPRGSSVTPHGGKVELGDETIGKLGRVMAANLLTMARQGAA